MKVSQDTDTSEGEVIAKRIAEAQLIKDAERKVCTLVDNEDGQWLSKTIADLRKGPAAISFSRGGVQSEADREFSFRSPVAGYCLSGEDESKFYTTHAMPVGFRVMKIRGSGYRDWMFRIDNNVEQWGRVYLHVVYNNDRQLMIVRHFSHTQAANSKRAGIRSKGFGPNRSVSR